MSVGHSWGKNDPRVLEGPNKVTGSGYPVIEPGAGAVKPNVNALGVNRSSQFPASALSTFTPTSEEQRELVRDQLQRVLSSAVFRNSKRYASVLKYIVDRTLEGRGDQLKERTIGTEVFGRAHDYDTGTDHAVRSAVSEVRKRLAQYYQEEGNASVLRIEVQSGSYVPQFRVIHAVVPLPVELPARPVELPPATVIAPLPPAERGSRTSLWIRRIAYVAVPLALVTGLLLRAKGEDTFENFWGPVLASRGQMLLCVGNLAGKQSVQDQKTTGPLTVLDFHSIPSQTVHVADAITLSRVASFVQARGKSFQVVPQSEATYTDLQNGPAVLIGLMNNDWTERLLPKLRFTVEHPSAPVIIIRDHNNPSMNDWALDYSVPYLDVTKDYALVLRVTDPNTDQMVVGIAGISVFGTLAAGEFLTNPNEIKKIEAIAPPGWKHKNLELVLSTDVIRGKPGHATIVASSFW